MVHSFKTAVLAAFTLTTLTFASDDQKPILPPHGIDIPSLGLGLWNAKEKLASKSVEYAFAAGYHHLDSAAAYSNEDYVGKGLSHISFSHSRSSYWITSKLWNTMHRPSLVHEALNKTLSQLHTPYLDLYLMHWPVAFVPDQNGRSVIDNDVSILDTWRAMEDLVRANLTRHIGVSNFSPRQLDTIMRACTICPYAHEFETHPYLQQQDFIDWHHKHDVKVIAYSPLANLNPTYKDKYTKIPPITSDPFWVKMAKTKGCTPAQAILAWGVQRGTVVIPKSTHEDRIKENYKSLKVHFSEEEMEMIAEQDKKARFNDPSKDWGVDPPLFEGLDDGSNRFLESDELR